MKSVSEALHARRCQGCRNQVQDIGIALACVIETGCLEEEYPLSVEGEFIGKLNARFQAHSHAEVGTTAYIDEL
jgi:hypothetical protein